jgi:pilus assembly protein CpaE
MGGSRVSQSTDIVLVESDTLLRSTLENYLSAQGLQVAAAVDNITSALNVIRALRPGILICELPPSPVETLESVRRVRNEYPQLGIILSAQDASSQLILSSIRAGAQEFLTRPLDFRELGEAVSRLLSLLDKTEPSPRRAGGIIAVCSSKGGAGVTSIATNLALSLSRETEAKTVIVDLNVQRGDVEMMLDLSPARTLSDVLASSPIDEQLLQAVLVPYSPNLFLLSGPEWPQYSERLSAVRLVEVFGLLKEMFSYIVIDAGRTVTTHTTEVLAMADIVLVVTVLDVVAIRNTRNHVRLLEERALSNGRVRLLVNRFQKDAVINVGDVEQATGKEVFWRIPNEYRTMSSALNAGNPAVALAPRSRVARSLTELAQALMGMLSPGADATA